MKARKSPLQTIKQGMGGLALLPMLSVVAFLVDSSAANVAKAGDVQIISFSVPSDASAGTVVKVFAAAQSTKGNAIYYFWDFGDGTDAIQGASASHIYSAPNTYTVTLTLSAGMSPTTLTGVVIVSASTATLQANLKAKLTFSDAYKSKDVAMNQFDSDSYSITSTISLPAGTTFNSADSIAIEVGEFSFSDALGGATHFNGKTATWILTDRVTNNNNGNSKTVNLGALRLIYSKNTLKIKVTSKTNAGLDNGTQGLFSNILFGDNGAETGSQGIAILLSSATGTSVEAAFNPNYAGKAKDVADNKGVDVGFVTVSGTDNNGVVSTQ